MRFIEDSIAARAKYVPSVIGPPSIGSSPWTLSFKQNFYMALFFERWGVSELNRKRVEEVWRDYFFDDPEHTVLLYSSQSPDCYLIITQTDARLLGVMQLPELYLCYVIKVS